jgi:hypothetical protein
MKVEFVNVSRFKKGEHVTSVSINKFSPMCSLKSGRNLSIVAGNKNNL